MKQTLLLLAFAICIKHSANAQTNVSGYILSNTTWTAAGSPYMVMGNTLVAHGATLTIEPGVVVKLDSTKALQIDGELIAIGTAQNRIIFTASSPSPVKGSWGRIQFKNSSSDAVFDAVGKYVSGSILKYCNVMYGGGIGSTGAIDCDSSAPHFIHCNISYSKISGIYFNYSANGGIDSSSIRHCNNWAMYYKSPTASDLTVSNDTIEFTRGIGAYDFGFDFNDGNLFNSAHFYNSLFTSNTDRVIYVYTSSCEISGNQFISNSSQWHPEGIDGLVYVSVMNYCLITQNEFRLNNISILGGYDWGSVLNVKDLWNYPSTKIISDNVFIANSIISTNPNRNGVVVRANGTEILNNYFASNSNVMELSSCRVRCNTFFQNQSTIYQDLFNDDYYGSEVENNIFEGNSAGSGRSLWNAGLNSLFADNQFKNNAAPNSNIITLTRSANVHNNDFLNNTGTSCLNINDQTDITSNNFQNPGVQYEITNLRLWGTPNIQAENNYWGTTNTVHIDSAILDFFDNAAYSVVFYLPILPSPVLVDTSCPIVVCSLSVTGTAISSSCHGGSNGSINITASNGATPYSYVWSTGSSSEDIGGLASGTYTITVIDANFCSTTKSFVISQPASPVAVASAVVANANCNSGGSINIAASGGASPYTYNWGSGLTTEDRTGLNPGNYSVTVRDNYNCSVTQSFTVGQDAGPYISGLATNTSCNNSCDGTITLSITGVTPFTYDWGTGFGTTEDTSGLCAGTYNVTVADSNNCGIATTFTITSPAALSATATITASVSCSGYSDGAATAAATGGTPPYSFLWSDGQTADTATALSAGVYDVTVTDSLGCTSVASVTAADGNNVFAGAIGGPTAASINQTATYIVSANVNYSYSWSVLNGVILSGYGSNSIEVAWTVAGTGLVELIASEQGCANTVSKQVTVVDTTQNCSALFYLYPDTIPHSYFVVNTASGIAPLYYLWNWGDGSNDTTTYPSHTYSAAGFYTICLTITDSAGCSDTYCNPYFLLKSEDESSAMIQVNVVPPTFTGLHGTVQENFTLYPNPTTGTVTLKGSNIRGSAVCTLLDAMGKQLIRKYFANGILAAGVPLDLSALHAGLYFLKIQTGNGSRILKVVKE